MITRRNHIIQEVRARIRACALTLSRSLSKRKVLKRQECTWSARVSRYLNVGLVHVYERALADIRVGEGTSSMCEFERE